MYAVMNWLININHFYCIYKTIAVVRILTNVSYRHSLKLILCETILESICSTNYEICTFRRPPHCDNVSVYKLWENIYNIFINTISDICVTNLNKYG